MRGVHKDMLQELETLKSRLKQLLYEGASERGRTRALLREKERKIEDRLAMLDSMETTWEEIGKKFRKKTPLARDAASRIPASRSHGQTTIASPKWGMLPATDAPKARDIIRKRVSH